MHVMISTAAASTRRAAVAVLATLFAPIFMVILDVFIVNVAAPSLRTELHASAGEVQWVVAAYVLTYAVSLITGGRLGDLYGRRRVFRVGVAAFTVTSALCAAAPSPTVLVLARLLQGVGGALMWPQVLAIIQVEFAPAERPRAFGIQGLVQGLAAVSGQIIGGALITLDAFGLGWRWVFLINLPVGLAAFVAAAHLLPESRADGVRRLDFGGVALATLALLLVVFPAIDGRSLGWSVWLSGALALAPLAAVSFVTLERRVAARGDSPLVRLSLFEQRGFRVGVLAAVALYNVVSFFLLLSIYLQDGLGMSAIDSGLAFTPLAVAFASASILGPRASERVRAQLPHAGAALAAAGLLTTLLAVQTAGVRPALALLIPAMVPVGAGMGLAIPSLINLVLRTVPIADAGAASGMLTTSQQVGNVLGVAIVGSIFFAELGARSGTGPYGDAFSLGLAVQAGLALLAAALVFRARVRTSAVEQAAAAEPLPAPAAPRPPRHGRAALGPRRLPLVGRGEHAAHPAAWPHRFDAAVARPEHRPATRRSKPAQPGPRRPAPCD